MGKCDPVKRLNLDKRQWDGKLLQIECVFRKDMRKIGQRQIRHEKKGRYHLSLCLLQQAASLQAHPTDRKTIPQLYLDATLKESTDLE